MSHIVLFAIGFSLPKHVQLKDGAKASISGSGPPLVFSTGLYGMMPPRLYSKFLNEIKRNFSVVTIDTPSRPLLLSDVECAADTIGCHRIGFMSHSSFDFEILGSDRIEKAVVFDPVAIPQISYGSLDSRHIEPVCPTLLLLSEFATQSENPFILPGFDLQVGTNDVYHLDNIGHCDILDPTWASLANRIGIRGMERFSKKQMNFKDWEWKDDQINLKKNRSELMKDIASRVAHFFKYPTVLSQAE